MIKPSNTVQRHVRAAPAMILRTLADILGLACIVAIALAVMHVPEMHAMISR